MAETELQKAAKKAEERYENRDKFSPMMKMYIETKAQYKDCILCYRLGDFFEMFFEDAIMISRDLELTLTGKDCGQEERAPMCGIPHHAMDTYIVKMIEKGYKVAICEQLEDPKKAVGIVKRDVIKVITPGTIVDGNVLEEKKNNYIMSIYKEGMFFGLAICDISTGEFYATEIREDNNFSKLMDEISRYNPAEIIVNKMMKDSESEIKEITARFNSYISEEEGFDQDDKKINQIFEITDKDGKNADISKKMFAISAVNALMIYIEKTQKQMPQNLNHITLYECARYMSLDINARRNLELTEKLRDKSKKGTLLWVLDKTNTSMGGRLLRRWINDPLINKDDINSRLYAVKELKEGMVLRDELIENLRNVYDIERLSGKISYGTANARDLISLKNSISQLPGLKQTLERCESPLLKELYKSLDTLDDLYNLINISIVDDPPVTVTDGGIIKKGFNEEIDKLIEITTNGKQWLVDVETREREATGIKNLKIGYNKVFGYYIEVTKSFLKMVPDDRYIRKQTLTTGERYITEELKNMENEIVGAKDKIVTLEYEEFSKVRKMVELNAKRLQISASVVAKIDVLCSLAEVAQDMNYCMPEVDDSNEVKIIEGRHPVIEKILPAGAFVQNDALLDNEEHRLNIITGPNMAGKSTYMRQVALITLMAQIGSFVPATEAHIGIVDKVFTRVGASDDLSMGESTFMVEMMEVASILKNATSKSLVILDEIGRGTSTYDGLSIAWAVAEYISKIKAKTLFATHYHELTSLEGKLEGTKNYHIAVKEKGEDVIFLRKILEGGTDESYGVHVARLAGVPKEATQRANEILRSLEKKSILKDAKAPTKSEIQEEQGQLSMYNYKLAEIAHELDLVKLEEITPLDALNILYKIKDKMK